MRQTKEDKWDAVSSELTALLQGKGRQFKIAVDTGVARIFVRGGDAVQFSICFLLNVTLRLEA